MRAGFAAVVCNQIQRHERLVASRCEARRRAVRGCAPQSRTLRRRGWSDQRYGRDACL